MFFYYYIGSVFVDNKLMDEIYKLEKENWWFKGRKELIFQLFDKIKIGKLKILDVGCGSGTIMEMLKQFGELSGMDISIESVKYVKSLGFKAVKADAQKKLPFKNSFFDVVLMLDILEHLKDDEEAIREIYRILKPKGYFILTVPALEFIMKNRIFWGPDEIFQYHKRRYSKKRLLNILKENRFNIREIGYWNSFMVFPVLLIRMMRKSSIKKGRQNMFDMVVGDIPQPISIINDILLSILKIENKLIKLGLNLPFGISIFCVARKK